MATETTKINIVEIDINVNKAVDEMATMQSEVSKLSNELKELKNATDKDNIAIAKKTAELKNAQKELRSLTTYTQNQLIADKAQTNTLEVLKAKLAVVTREWNKLTKEEINNTESGKLLAKQKKELTALLEREEKATGDARRGVGKYELAVKSATNELIGAAGFTIGIAGAVQAFQNFDQRAKELINTTKLVTQNFGLQGDSAKRLSSDILALANNFDTDYKEVITASNTVSKSFGISGKQAVDLITEGFQKGLNNSGQFLDMLKEYPVQFKAAGIDANTMFGIINQQVKQGIYSDKGIDAIKEGGLRLRENTKATQDALAPLDLLTKQRIKDEVAAGNSFKAIQLVSKALSENKLTAQQTQTIIADVFGGAGEDAGLEYIKTLKDIKSGLSDVAKQTSEVDDANMKLSKSYNDFVQGVSDGSGVISKAWSGLLDITSEFLDNLSGMNSESKSFTDKLIDGLEAASPIIAAISKGIKNLFGIKDEKETPINLGWFDPNKLMQDALIFKNTVISKDKEINNERTKLTKEQQKARQDATDKALKEEINAFRNAEAEKARIAREEALAAQEVLQNELAAIERAGIFDKELSDLKTAKQQYDNDVQIELAKNNIFARLDLERQALEEKRTQELSYAASIGADTVAMEEKFAEARKEINRAEMDAKLSLAAGFAGNIATIFGENSKVGKAAAIAQTTISTYQAATGAYAALAPIPIVGPVLGAAAAAAAVVAGIANVKKILAVKIPGGDSGGGSVPQMSSAQTSAPRQTSFAPSVNQGIVSRQTTNNQKNSQALQPTLVIDQVTQNQSRQTSNMNTSII